jgi:hypothetical protein
MAQPNSQAPAIDVQGLVASQFNRRLSQVSFRANSVQTLDIPRDDVIKRINLRLTGSQSVTFASGSPVIGGFGIFPGICSRIDVVQNGQDTIKSLDLQLLRMMNLVATGEVPERAITKQAGAFSTRLAQTELEFGGSAYQATTGFMLFNEALTIYFEYPFAYEVGKNVSLWNTKGLSSAELRFAFNTMDGMQEYGVGATVTYADDLVPAIDVELVTAPSIPRDQDFMLYKQTVRRYSFSAESRDYLVDLPRGNKITGLHIMVRNGDTNKRLSDIALKDIQLLINGQRIIQRTTFLTMQQAVRQRFGLRSVKGTAAQGISHNMQGYAYLHLVRDGDVRSALDTSIAAGVDQVQLALTTAPSSGTDAATYTNGVEVSILVDELCEPVKRF